MFHCHRLRAILSLKAISELPQTPECYPFLKPHKSPIFLNLLSTTSDQQPSSFTISYLTNNCGLSLETARKAYKRVRFDTSLKPDSVIAFFRNHGFSISQIHSIIGRVPELLACDPNKRVLPKFEFLASKGASSSDIVLMVTKSPDFLRKSLENHITPAFELARRFFPSDERFIASVIGYPTFLSDARVEPNVKLLLDVGVTHSNIYHLLRTRPSILCSSDLKKAVEEVKGLGFDPSKSSFSVALLAKRAITKSQWDAKVDAFKNWGWSEDAISHAFRKHPNFMLRSADKINAVISFWVDQLGWDPSVLLASPNLFGFSLEKRFIPRASVIQYLLSKDMIKKDASLATPFVLSDKLFLQKFVKCFEEEEASRLLRLYQGEC
ncbi:uncharacterized protein LOC133294548 [Gastrolobium bilobum]|uniref:uncharacterized protein LOC133294548 n=1 Tax=Gastrolobium bilobum TaxID=150636 RepID=UPI002AB2EEFE|nr:uncharacterized protein LOC133294548 [Gastrolobium bilobum]